MLKNLHVCPVHSDADANIYYWSCFFLSVTFIRISKLLFLYRQRYKIYSKHSQFFSPNPIDHDDDDVRISSEDTYMHNIHYWQLDKNDSWMMMLMLAEQKIATFFTKGIIIVIYWLIDTVITKKIPIIIIFIFSFQIF